MGNVMDPHLRSIFDDGELELNEVTGVWEKPPTTPAFNFTRESPAKKKSTSPVKKRVRGSIFSGAREGHLVIRTTATSRTLTLATAATTVQGARRAVIASATREETRINQVVLPQSEPQISNLILYVREKNLIYDLRYAAFVRVPEDKKEEQKIVALLFDLLARPLFFATMGVEHEKLYGVGGMAKEVWLDAFGKKGLRERAGEVRARFVLSFTVRAMRLKGKLVEMGVYPPLPETLKEVEQMFEDKDGHEARRRYFAGLFTPRTEETDALLRTFYQDFSKLLDIDKMLNEDGPAREMMVFNVSKMSALVYKNYILDEECEKIKVGLFHQDSTELVDKIVGSAQEV